MVNKDKTGGIRSRRLREERAKWLAENAYGLSAEGLIGALMRGECSLSWASVPTKRAPDAGYCDCQPDTPRYLDATGWQECAVCHRPRR